MRCQLLPFHAHSAVLNLPPVPGVRQRILGNAKTAEGNRVAGRGIDAQARSQARRRRMLWMQFLPARIGQQPCLFGIRVRSDHEYAAEPRIVDRGRTSESRSSTEHLTPCPATELPG